MLPARIHSYLLWRSSVEPTADGLSRFRYTAAISLLPAVMVGLLFYGWYAGLVLLVGCLGGLAVDLIGQRFSGYWVFQNPQGPRDGSWLLCGLLVGLLLPPSVPLWIPLLGGSLAILVGKHWLSADGMPWLQPAAVALLLLNLFCFPWLHPSREVTRWAADSGLLPSAQTPLASQPQRGRTALPEAWVSAWERTEGAGWRVKAVLKNGQRTPLTLDSGTLRLLAKDGTSVKAVRNPLQGRIPGGGQVELEFALEEALQASSYELQVDYRTRVEAWPMLILGLVPAKGEGQAGILAHLSDRFRGGDVRSALDRFSYESQLFAGVQPLDEVGRRAEAVFSARPLDLLQLYPGQRLDSEAIPRQHRLDTWDVLLEATPGSIGGYVLALLLGILLLLFSRSISWVLPLAAVGTFVLCAYLLKAPHPGIHLLNGYTLLGFFYLAASPLTAPRSFRGKLLAGILVGALELALRQFTPLSEGIWISVIAVQALSLVLDQYLAPPRPAAV